MDCSFSKSSASKVGRVRERLRAEIRVMPDELTEAITTERTGLDNHLDSQGEVDGAVSFGSGRA